MANVQVKDKVGVLLLNLGGPETLDDVQVGLCSKPRVRFGQAAA